MSTLILMDRNMLLLKQRHNWEFAQQQRLFPEIITQLLKLVLKLGFRALLWRKSFFLPNNWINFKRICASPLRAENREVFRSTWKTRFRRESVFTAPSLRRRQAGTAGSPNFYSKREEPASPIERHGTQYFPKRGSSKINRIMFTRVFGSLHLNVWSLSQSLLGKKRIKKTTHRLE